MALAMFILLLLVNLNSMVVVYSISKYEFKPNLN